MTNKKHLIKIGLILGVFALLLSVFGVWHSANAKICIDPWCGGGGGGGGGGGLPTTIAPTLNSASPRFSYYVNLTWTDNDPTSSFAVYRSTDGVNFSAIAINLSTTQYHDAGLTCGTKYYYGITALKSGKTGSSMSNVLSATTLCPPTLNSATAISSSKATLAWTNNATGQTGFTANAGLTSTGATVSVSNLSPTATSYTFSGLTCGTYVAWVTADDVNGPSSNSNTIQFSIACAVPPPTLNSATPISQTAMNIMFTNNLPNNGGGMYVYNNGALVNTTGVLGITGTPTSFINGTGGWGPNLTCGTTYSYYVRAYDGTNYSANSNTITGTTLSCSTPLNDDPYFVTISNSVTQPSYIDKGLASDTVYMYRVRPVFSNGSVGGWAVPKAAKTLIGSASITSVSAPVCTRNSYCDFSLKSFANTPGEVSEVQCANNNDCRKVGKLRSTYQEQ